MEPLKALADLSQADPRNQLWVVIDPSLPGGTRPITLVDEYSEMFSHRSTAGTRDRSPPKRTLHLSAACGVPLSALA